MKVLLDALSLHSGGAQIHLRKISEHCSKLSLVVLLNKDQASVFNFDERVSIIRAPSAVNNSVIRQVWRRLHLKRIIRDIGADVYFDPAGGAPAIPIPRVAMVRNMLPFDKRVHEWYGLLTYQSIRLRTLQRQTIRAVAKNEGTIFISEWSRRRINEFQDNRPSHLSALIPHGVNPPTLVSRPWPASPRWLYVSDIEPYKHQIEAVLAYDAARAQGCMMSKLVLAGRFANHDYEKLLRSTISQLRFGAEIELTGWISRENLNHEMDLADGLLFVSSVECCPNILLEGLAAGKPTVCSKYPPMKEFAKDAVIYVDSTDPMSIAEGMRRVMRMGKEERDALVAMARAEASHFDWKTTAEKTWAFVEEVAARHRRANVISSCAE